MVWQTLEAKLSTPRMNRLRNRCFHHEPLLWQPLFDLHRDILEMVQWIDPRLCIWIENHDRLPTALVDWSNWKEAAKRQAVS